jgi:hypothetical protein
MITSKQILELLEGTTLHFGVGSKTSKDVDAKDIQAIRTARYVKKGGDTSLEDNVISNFKFDPLSGVSTWNEIIDGQESFITLSFTEIDAVMLNFVYQPYIPYPGILLNIKKGTSSKMGKGVRYDPTNSTSYIYAPSYRSDVTKIYQEFSALSNRARVDGLNGIEFPENWDGIPYVV